MLTKIGPGLSPAVFWQRAGQHVSLHGDDAAMVWLMAETEGKELLWPFQNALQLPILLHPTNHPSIHFLYLLNPTVGSHGGQRQTTSNTLTLTPTDNLETPVNLTCMFLDGGRKPEYPERTHAHTVRTCRLHIERELNLEPFAVRRRCSP